MIQPLPVVRDRFQVIEQYARTGKVLDVGCVDGRPKREHSSVRVGRKPDLLFKRLVALNGDTLGIDVDAEGIDALKRSGYRAMLADAQTSDLQEQFDTVVAGELIEHLDCPGLFLRNMARHLRPNGVLLVSTPNPFSSRRFWKILRYGHPAVHEDHTCWFDPITLEQSMRRAGLTPIAQYWLQPSGKPLLRWPSVLRPYFSHHFLTVARRPASP
jgi:2-polyprenyl-3-methyl-5-hydroxy-6-metoxy-1,4-benzoquinol methylase